MSKIFETLDEAFEALSNPGGENWAQAFVYLFSHPDTSEMMLKTFQDTLGCRDQWFGPA